MISRPFINKVGESSRKKIWIEDHLESGAGAPGVRHIIAIAIREVDFFGSQERCPFMAMPTDSVGAMSDVHHPDRLLPRHSGSGTD